MLKIYRTAIGFVAKNPLFFGVLALLMMGLSILFEYTGKGGTGGVIAWVIVVYVLNRALMFDEVQLLKKVANPRRPVAMGRFIGAALLLFFGSVIFGIVVFIAAFGSLDMFEQDPDTIVLASLALFTIGSLLMSALFGTALPAAAAADRWGPAISLQRAGRTWWRIIGGLLVGPFLFAALGIAALLGFEAYSIGVQPYFTSTGAIDPAQLLIGFAINVGMLFHTLLTVTVLVLAYQRVAPVEVQAAMGYFEEKAEVFA